MAATSGAHNTAEDWALAGAIGERIRTLRLERGLKGPRDLARLIDPEDYVNLGGNLSAIENGRHLVRVPLLVKIARALEVPSSVLLGELDNGDESYRVGYRTALSDVSESVAHLRRNGVTP